MVDRYCGPGGNDANSGLTWALRKLTLNGVEDTPVVAGDVCYIGPGVYRESLTVDVSGGVGNEIIYVADITGENTDSIGGVVRVTGSNNDQAAARASCITADNKDYRIFRGFAFDLTTNDIIQIINGADNWTIEDCLFQAAGAYNLEISGVQANWAIRRCTFLAPAAAYSISFNHGVAVDNSGHMVENCLFLGSARGSRGIESQRVGGITVRNCLFRYNWNAVRIGVVLTVGQTITVNNCILEGGQAALSALVLGEIVEDYNTFWQNATDRGNVNVGANSQTYPALYDMEKPRVATFRLRDAVESLSEWSPIRALTDTGAATDDLYGMTRPVTAGKRSWGPIEYHPVERETGTVRTGSVSLVLHDAGRHQIIVPIDNAQTTISVWVRREANYAGNLPQMIIRQPDVAARVTTSVAAVNTWEELTDTFTPAALPPYVIVEFVSRNTAAAGNYETFFDDMEIDGANVDIGTFERWIGNRMFFEDNPGFATGFQLIGRGVMRGV